MVAPIPIAATLMAPKTGFRLRGRSDTTLLLSRFSLMDSGGACLDVEWNGFKRVHCVSLAADHGGAAAIDIEDLAGGVFAGVGGEHHGGTLEGLVVACLA